MNKDNIQPTPYVTNPDTEGDEIVACAFYNGALIEEYVQDERPDVYG